MRKIISFMHISLDGFVAGPNGEMDWIKVDDEIFDHVHERISGTDTAMYGRVTYDMMEGYWPNAGKAPDASKHDKQHSGWYAKAHKLVLSRSLNGKALPNTTILCDALAERVNAIRHTEGSEILLFGSPTATHVLMELGLIDGYWLFVNPIILGKGVPLFKGITEKIKLKVVSNRSFANGVEELSYEV